MTYRATSPGRHNNLENICNTSSNDSTNGKSDHWQWSKYHVLERQLDDIRTIPTHSANPVHFRTSSKLHSPIAAYGEQLGDITTAGALTANRFRILISSRLPVYPITTIGFFRSEGIHINHDGPNYVNILQNLVISWNKMGSEGLHLESINTTQLQNLSMASLQRTIKHQR